MTIRIPSALLAASLLLAGCAKDGGQSAAAASDSAANAAAAQVAPEEATAPAAPTGIAGTPGFAQRGVDSANAAQQQRLNDVNNLSDQATGTQPQP